MDLEDLDVNTMDLELYIKNNKQDEMKTSEIKSIKTIYRNEVFDEPDSYIRQIAFVEWRSVVGFGYGTKLYVLYHHSNDPSQLQVVLDAYELVKEKIVL